MMCTILWKKAVILIPDWGGSLCRLGCINSQVVLAMHNLRKLMILTSVVVLIDLDGPFVGESVDIYLHTT